MAVADVDRSPAAPRHPVESFCKCKVSLPSLDGRGKLAGDSTTNCLLDFLAASGVDATWSMIIDLSLTAGRHIGVIAAA